MAVGWWAGGAPGACFALAPVQELAEAESLGARALPPPNFLEAAMQAAAQCW
jgi:hypothetical protein